MDKFYDYRYFVKYKGKNKKNFYSAFKIIQTNLNGSLYCVSLIHDKSERLKIQKQNIHVYKLKNYVEIDGNEFDRLIEKALNDITKEYIYYGNDK